MELEIGYKIENWNGNEKEWKLTAREWKKMVM